MSEKRSIFEEVDAKSDKDASPEFGLIDRASDGARVPIRRWLQLLFALVVVMTAIGGLTRLTDSGLSITEWRPITGMIPPLSAIDWQREFDLYKQIPEFQLQNQTMTLAEFKFIFWWEWGHRQFGRLIGLVWAGGFAWFALRRQIPTGWTPRLFGLGVLGGLQGAIGWWMVSSGLEGTALDVASTRLAVHLGLAFIILAAIAWSIFHFGRSAADKLKARRAREERLGRIATIWIVLVFVQVLLGALVAGIDAGRNFTDWPLMAGGFFPPNPFEIDPLWRNFVEDDGLAQFTHRMVGYVLLAFGIYAWRQARNSGNFATKFAFNAAFAAMVLQIVLGIITVLYGAPLLLAILHQILAVVLWTLLLRARFLTLYPLTQSLRG